MTVISARIGGRHVLFAMLAFFGVVIAVNGVFVYFALSTFSGLSTENAYTKGLGYNATLEEARIQHDLGWQVAATIDGAVVRLAFTDRDGRPLDGLALEARVARPATAAFDGAVAFEAEGGGRYVAAEPLVGSGAWRLRVRAVAADGRRIDATYRLWAQP